MNLNLNPGLIHEHCIPPGQFLKKVVKPFFLHRQHSIQLQDAEYVWEPESSIIMQALIWAFFVRCRMTLLWT